MAQSPFQTLTTHGYSSIFHTSINYSTDCKFLVRQFSDDLQQTIHAYRLGSAVFTTLGGAGIAQTLQKQATDCTAAIRFSAEAKHIFLFPAASRQILWPTQAVVQWVPGVLSPAVSWQGRETNHSPSCSAEGKNTSITPYVSCAQGQL
jgi:hypothetical protein